MCAERIWLDIPAAAAYLHLISECIAELVEHAPDVPELERTTYSIQLATQEIGSNIVRHAYGEADGEARIVAQLCVERSPRRLVIELRDNGLAFDLAQVGEPDLDEVRVHGYGLFLARTLLDELRYETRPGENRWRLVKQLG
ncbi:MAG TPA: ATP-binding protein [Chloroflexaceae bacterium]|nr:ATP-binding protein [Chloroflexaceae bacterium]